jgi:hypothetical protein
MPKGLRSLDGWYLESFVEAGPSCSIGRAGSELYLATSLEGQEARRSSLAQHSTGRLQASGFGLQHEEIVEVESKEANPNICSIPSLASATICSSLLQQHPQHPSLLCLIHFLLLSLEAGTVRKVNILPTSATNIADRLHLSQGRLR